MNLYVLGIGMGRLKLYLLVVMAINLNFVYGQGNVFLKEIELKSGEKNFELIPVESHGLVIFSKITSTEREKEIKYQLRKLNNQFQEVAARELVVKKRFAYVSHAYNKGNVYFLFYHHKKKILKFIKYDLVNGKLSSSDVVSISKLEIDEFIAVNDCFFLKGTVMSSYALMYAKMENKKLKILTTSFRGNPSISDLKVNELKNRVEVGFLHRTRFSSNVSIKTFNYEGKLLREFKVIPHENDRILNGRLTEFSENELYVSGTYSSGQKGENRGVFIAKFDHENQLWIKLNSFRSQEALDDLLKKDSLDKNNKQLLLDTKLFFKDSENTLHLAAEIFQPTFETRTSTSFDATGMPMTTTYKVFSGWKYTDGVIFQFSEKGTLKNSITFKTDEISAKTKKDVVFYRQDTTPWKIQYTCDKTLYSYLFLNKQWMEKKVEVVEFDIPISSGIKNWYGRSFISWNYLVEYDEKSFTSKKKFVIAKFDL